MGTTIIGGVSEPHGMCAVMYRSIQMEAVEMKFVTLIKFTGQGFQNIGETTERAALFQEQATDAGIKISELLWLSGRYDGIIVFEADDFTHASSVMLKLSQSGNVNTETFQAFDAVEMKKIVDRI